jgi:hypothetical protein
MGAEGEELEPVGPGFERAGGLWRQTDGVQRSDFADLLIELDVAATAQDHVGLFCLCVAMGEGASLAGPQPEVGHAGGLGVQRCAGDARFPPIAEAVAGCCVIDVEEVEVGEGLQGGCFTGRLRG